MSFLRSKSSFVLPLALLLLGSCDELTLLAPASITQQRLSIETANDGSGTVVDAVTLLYGTPQTVYAVIRDPDDQFKGSAEVTWSVSSSAVTLSATSGASTALTLASLGSAVLTATHATLSAVTTGTITGSFAPSQVANQSLWLASTSLDYVNYANGDSVSVWPDLSAGDNNAIQATSAAQPLYTAGSVNSLPSVTFDGTDDALFIEQAITAQPSTIFVVGRYNNPANDGPYLGHSVDTTMLGYAATDVRMTGSAATLAATRSHPSSFEILSLLVRDAASESTLFANALSLVSAVNDWTTTPVTFNRIGLDAAAVYLQGDIAEILVYSRALNTSEIAFVHAYLSNKFAITLE